MTAQMPDLTGLPTKWIASITALVVLGQVIGRAITAIANKGGFVGIWRSVWMGSTTVHNPPTPKDEKPLTPPA